MRLRLTVERDDRLHHLQLVEEANQQNIEENEAAKQRGEFPVYFPAAKF